MVGCMIYVFLKYMHAVHGWRTTPGPNGSSWKNELITFMIKTGPVLVSHSYHQSHCKGNRNLLPDVWLFLNLKYITTHALGAIYVLRCLGCHIVVFETI